MNRQAKRPFWRQRGAALLITALLIMFVAVFAALVTSSMSGSGVIDSAWQGDSADALFTAESGLEHTIKLFSTGTACGSAGMNTANVEVVTGSGRNFTTTSFTTGFDGITTLGATQCRLQSTGTVTATGVTRKIQAIVDKNLLAGEVNSNFNNTDSYPTQLPPSGWTDASGNAIRYALTGGPDGTAPECSRSAYLRKSPNGAGTASGAGNLAVSFDIAAGTVLTVRFDYRITRDEVTVGSTDECDAWNEPAAFPGDPNFNALSRDSEGAVAIPVAGCGSGGNDANVCFRFSDTGGLSHDSNTLKTDASVTTVAIPCILGSGPNPNGVRDTETTYASCSTGYQAGYPATKGALTITVGGTGTRTINNITFYMWLKSGKSKEIFLDNIEVTGTAGSGAARTYTWRDCSVTSCP